MTEQKHKVPGQLFQWFDSLKQGYENSIHKLFNRVEEVNEDHKQQLKTVYQGQIDGLKKSYQDHLHSLKDSHQAQTDQSGKQIRQLEKDAQFYQDQIQRQNQTIDKLNDRYDAVIFALMDNMDRQSLENVMKDISPADKDKLSFHLDNASEDDEPAPLAQIKQQVPTQQPEAAEPEPPSAFVDKKRTEVDEQIDQALQQAFDARQIQQFAQAYELFLTAARAGSGKAMGAIGRAYFVGEGVKLDKATGLAWLMRAAEHEFEPAHSKVQSAKSKSPELYQAAKEIAETLINI
jgi:TPR repeat protein